MSERQLVVAVILAGTLLALILAAGIFWALGYPLHNTSTNLQLPTI